MFYASGSQSVGRDPLVSRQKILEPLVYAEIHKGIALVLRISILLSPIYRKLCRTSRNPSSKYRKWEAMYLDGHFKFQIFIDADADGDGLDVTRYFRERNVHQPKEKKYKMCLPSFLWPAWVLSQLETEQEEHSDMSQIRQLVMRILSFSTNRNGFEKESNLLAKGFVQLDKKFLHASFKIACTIAKQRKAHTIAENLVMLCAVEMVKIMIGEKEDFLFKSKERYGYCGYGNASAVLEICAELFCSFFQVLLDN
ncbi:hypothetical protein T4B_5116 [Trichinella pseudospiralis]|uniref:Uncharacterized protein n=1 Tax=Trichinella pseudospiralis TaxID=6337 RepID=A0A0V1KF44_TRIPS|nr:hypothetical protein T4B_5116 [Trichinella pseudospiralis]KRZ45887.1 hypothetical protein T4C_4796 [Trichinella pseudospiralis]